MSFISTRLLIRLGTILVTGLFLFKNMALNWSDPLSSLNWGTSSAGNSAAIVRPGGPVAGSISQTRDYRSPTYGQTVPYPTVKGSSTSNIFGAGLLAGAEKGISRGLNNSPASNAGASAVAEVDTGNRVDVGNSGPSPEDMLRGEISSGWDSYISSLDQQLQGLTGQRTAQEGIAQNQLNTGMNNLNLQKTQGEQQLGGQRTRADQNQVKTLRDLAGNLRNSFMAGNVYLGSRGAGDSSAANQYSYALTKLGSQQRGDVMSQTADIMSQIDERETNLKNIYDTETRNLQEGYNQQINQIASWFSDAQNQIRMAQSQGQLNKSQDLQNLSKDLYNQGMNFLSQVRQQTDQKRSMLDQWVAGNAKSIEQARSQMSQNAQFTADLPTSSPISGAPQMDAAGNIRVAAGYGGANDDQRNNLFTNPSSWLTSY